MANRVDVRVASRAAPATSSVVIRMVRCLAGGVIVAACTTVLARCEQSTPQQCVVSQKFDCADSAVYFPPDDAGDPLGTDVLPGGNCVGLPPGFTSDNAYPNPSRWAFPGCYASRDMVYADSTAPCSDQGGIVYYCFEGVWAPQL